MYELVRQRHFQQKPSRFEALFLCLSEGDLNEFRATNGRRFDLGYEVELVDGTARSHLGDWTLPSMQNTDDMSVLEARATLYWQGNNIVKQELVTASPIRVLRLLA